MGKYLQGQYEERDLAKTLAKVHGIIDDETKKLSDKVKELKLSHKKQETLLINFRNLLLALQNGIHPGIYPKYIEETLRKVNLVLGYNQWKDVKEVKVKGGKKCG